MNAPNQTVDDQQDLFGEEIVEGQVNSGGILSLDPAFLDEQQEEVAEQLESTGPETPDVTTEENAPEWADPTKPDLDVESAAKHWKKRHNDSQRYISKIKQQYGGITPDQVQNLLALQKVISRSPQLMDQVYAAIDGRPVTPANNPAPEPEVVKPPEDFNPSDIYDPSTESGRWWLQQEQRRTQQLENRILQGVTSLISEDRKQTAIAQQKAARQHEFTQFATANSLTQEEQIEFEEFVTKGPGRQVTLEDMFKFYRLLREGEIESRPAVDITSHIEKAKKPVVPPTANLGPQKNLTNTPDDDSFGNSLLQAQRSNRIVITK